MSSASPRPAPSSGPSAGQGLVDGVDQRGLVAVERLDAEPHAARERRARRRARGARAVVVRRRPLVGVHPPDPAGGGVERAAHRRRRRSRRRGRRRRAGSPAWRRRRRRSSRPGRGPGAIAPTTYGVRPVLGEHRRDAPRGRGRRRSRAAARPRRSPRSAIRREQVGQVASVSGEVQTQVLTPMRRTGGSFRGMQRWSGVVVGRAGRRVTRPTDAAAGGAVRPDQGIWRSCQTSG